jgi:SAM-dependent methyltransferase
MTPSKTTATATPASPTTAIDFQGFTFPLERVPCDFCGSQEFHTFWHRMRHGLNLPTVLCKICGLCMTNPRPTAEANNLFYSQLYNRFHKRETPLEIDSPYLIRSRRLAGPRVECLSQFLDPRQSPSVFEIGAGVGQFQVAARERTSWRISGLEPGNEQSALCKRQGLDVTQAFFQTMPIDDESLDAVVSFHVLEHVDSPAEFLRHVNRILRPGGLLHLEVPNLARWAEDGLDQFFQFPHLFSFTATTLRNYLTTIGGFRAIYSADRAHSLTMVARKIGPASADAPKLQDFERFDVVNFMDRLRMMERVRRLARCIPRWSVLGKVRSTLESI